MAVIHYGKPASKAFSPNEKQVNALIGLLIGQVEYGFSSGGSGIGALEVDWDWIKNNIPDANRRMNELIRHGFVWESQWSAWEETCGKVYSFGLSDEGSAWVEKHLGIQEDLFEEDEEQARKLVAPLYERFVRKGEEPSKIEPVKTGRKATVKTGRKATVKTTTKWITKLSYTPLEAELAVTKARNAVERGKLNPRSLAAIKAHITRRTVRAA